MQNKTLAQDYIVRAEHRIAAVEVLFKNESWADVVRESQEIVELALKALLRQSQVEPPRLHDVSEVLIQQKSKIPAFLHSDLDQICAISRSLRRDRELAFYGTEDLTPSEFYKKEDAKKAMTEAQWIVHKVKAAF